ncbi:MAG: hypothetical protein H7Y11_09335 [Armatimonadetes bacterium]|nr:hypothetical protein [Anaerolineae bacterium]
MTCSLVNEEEPTVSCNILTHVDNVLGRSRIYRVTQFADVSALNPGSTVVTASQLSTDQGRAFVQYRYETGQWGSISTDMTIVKNAVVETETDMLVTNNRVEFLIEGVRNVRLNVRFTNPAEPDTDAITRTTEPFVSIVGDGDEALSMQSPFLSIVGGNDGGLVTQEAFMWSVGGDDATLLMQTPFVSIVDGEAGASETPQP